MTRRVSRLVRPIIDVRGADRLELFVVSAVVTILLTRGYLHLTGYPQVGGTLHIAHLLWGALAMLVALLMTLGLVGRSVGDVASWVGGIGFGLLIDEVGKFVTKDNNYFFRPAAAIMYATFVVIIVAAHEVARRFPPRPADLLANAAALASEGLAHGLRDRAREDALQLVESARAGGADPEHCAAITRMIRAMPTHADRSGPYERMRARLVALLGRLTGSTRVATIVVVYLCVVSVMNAALAVTAASLGEIDRIHIAVSMVVLVLVVAGAWKARRRPVVGLSLLRAALLVQLLVGQVQTFAQEQFAAVGGALAALVMLAVVDASLHRHQTALVEPAPHTAP